MGQNSKTTLTVAALVAGLQKVPQDVRDAIAEHFKKHEVEDAAELIGMDGLDDIIGELVTEAMEGGKSVDIRTAASMAKKGVREALAALPGKPAAGKGPAVKAEDLNPEDLLNFFAQDEARREEDAVVEAMRRNFPFFFIKREGKAVTVMVEETLRYLRQTKDAPPRRTYRGMTVTTVDKLVDRTTRVSPWDGTRLIDGCDKDEVPWEYPEATMAFIAYFRGGSVSDPTNGDKHVLVDDLEKAGGDYAKLAGSRWKRAVEDFGVAREEDEGLVKRLLAGLVKRDSVPPAPAAANPPTGTRTPAAPSDLLSDLTPAECKEFLAALLDAFPRWEAMWSVFRHELNMNLEAVVVRAALNDAYARIINRAAAEGWAHRLLVGARAENPGNDALRRFEAAVMAKRQPPAGPRFTTQEALRRAFREEAARLFGQRSWVEMYARDCGLRTTTVNFDHGAESAWEQVITIAVASGKLTALVRRLREEQTAEKNAILQAVETQIPFLF